MVEVFAGWLSPTANPPVGCVNGMLGRVSLGETSNCVERAETDTTRIPTRPIVRPAAGCEITTTPFVVL